MHRLPFFEDASGFAHIHSPHHHRFTKHSSETFLTMADDLEGVHGDARKAREMAYGLNYEPTELLWCREVRQHQ